MWDFSKAEWDHLETPSEDGRSQTKEPYRCSMSNRGQVEIPTELLQTDGHRLRARQSFKVISADLAGVFSKSVIKTFTELYPSTYSNIAEVRP
jgi:hypothetical protein